MRPSMPRIVGRQQRQSNVETENQRITAKERSQFLSFMGHLISEMDTHFDPNNDAVSVFPNICVLPALLVSREGNAVQAALQYCADDLPSLQGFDARPFRWLHKWLSAHQDLPSSFKPGKNATMNYFRTYARCCLFCVHCQSHMLNVNDRLVHCAD